MLLFFAILKSCLVVKVFILFLIALTVFTVGMFVERWAIFSFQEKASKAFDKEFNSGEMLDIIYNRLYNKPKIHAPLARLFFVGMRELTQSNIRNIDFSMDYADGIKQNIRNRMLAMTSVEKTNITMEMKGNIDYFITIAVVSPLLGIVATMYGIMDSIYEVSGNNVKMISLLYSSISSSVVGIFCGILGLIFYNVLVTKINKDALEHESFAVKVANILSRELDFITTNAHAKKALNSTSSS